MTENKRNTPTDRVLTYKEHLTYYLNIFRDKELGFMIDYRHYVRLRIEQPDYTEVNRMTGQPVGVGLLIASQLKGLKYARQTVKMLSSLLADIGKSDEKAEKFLDEMTLIEEEPAIVAKIPNKK